MTKTLSKTKSLSPSKPSLAHFSAFAKQADGLSLPKNSRAIIGLDPEKRPAWFLFDMRGFWEFVCRIDELLADSLPDGEYEKNPVGKLVDEIESRWPFDKSAKKELKREYELALKDIAAGRVSVL